jgi:hypothetical protein
VGAGGPGVESWGDHVPPARSAAGGRLAQGQSNVRGFARRFSAPALWHLEISKGDRPPGRRVRVPWNPSGPAAVRSSAGLSGKHAVALWVHQKAIHLHKLSLGILKEIQLLSPARTDLASWTIDWLSNGQLLRQNRYQASGDEFGSYTRAGLFDEPPLLPIEVLSVGTVTEVLALPPDNVFSLQVGTLVQTLRAWRYAAGVPERHDELIFCRTLFQDASIDESSGQCHRFLPEVDLPKIEMWWLYFQGVSWIARVLDYNDMINYRCRNRLLGHLHGDNFKPNISFCVLDSGHIGILPLRVRVGDIVAVAKGLDYPIVLRIARKEGSPEEEENKKAESTVFQEELSSTAKFLGCAYFDGIMYGEAVSAESDWKLIHLTGVRQMKIARVCICVWEPNKFSVPHLL